jgi:osmotically-inducible protein OsmY
MTRSNHSNRTSNGRRTSVTTARESPRGREVGPTPPATELQRHRREASSEELFGRQPFTYGRGPRYFGTGVPGYQRGPGFTGGYYGYGDETPEIPTELEREYTYDLYGEGPGGAWTQGGPEADQARYQAAGAAGTPRHQKHLRQYPPGPKGYQRTDQRMREDICDQLMRTGHIDSSDVTVEVSGAKVRLDGSVPARWMKHAIEDVADGCPGVQDIENRISVKRPSHSR